MVSRCVSLILALVALPPRVVDAQLPAFITQWGTFGTGNSQFQYPMGITFDAAGNVYVADWFNCRIQVFTSDGSYVKQWGIYGSGHGEFSGPIGVALDQTGNIYVTDWSTRIPLVNNRVQVFNSSAAYVTEWGQPLNWGEPGGTGPGEFHSPEGIVVDANGIVYVADTFNHRIQVFTGSGAYVTEWAGLSRPRLLAIAGNGNVYAADDGADCVHVFGSGGAYLARVGSGNSGP